MKVILQYSTALGDGNTVNKILAEENIHIIKTFGERFHPKIKFKINDYDHLNSVMQKLNKTCYDSVNVVKVKKMVNMFLEK